MAITAPSFLNLESSSTAVVASEEKSEVNLESLFRLCTTEGHGVVLLPLQGTLGTVQD